MNHLLQHYCQIRNELVDYLEKLPVNNRETQIYEGWTVKDLIAHLSGWAEYQVTCLKLFVSGVKDIPKPKVQDRNEESVEKRKILAVKEIKEEFITLSADMVRAYGNLSNEQWQKPIWEGTKTTPEKFIKIEIKHYQETHFPELKRVTG